MLMRDICRLLGLYLFVFGLILFVPLLLAAYYQFYGPAAASHPQPHSTEAFGLTIVSTFALSLLFYRMGRHATGQFYRREGIALVVMIWLLTPAIAALPFLFSKTLENPLQAYFETVSGFTTTGATTLQAKAYDPLTGQEIPIERTFCGVINTTYRFWGNIDPVRDSETGAILHEGIEAVGKALLFWRCMMQWLGGGGIIVLFVAILPALGMGGKILFQSEVPGPIKDALTPRITETAVVLWKVYLTLTALEVAFLLFTNREMTLYNAVLITFSTLSTGGYSCYNQNIAAFHSVATETVIILFMILGSINFALYYYGWSGKFFRLYDPELGLFLLLITLSSGLVCYFIWGTPNQLLSGEEGGLFTGFEAIRYGIFQTVSAMSSTGFSTNNYDIWPYRAQVFLLLVMFVGGMAGSTAGGIKIVRHYLLFRITQYKVESLFRPASVRLLRIGNREVDSHAAMMTLSFFICIITAATFGTLFFILDGIDPETAIGLVACMVNNIGLAFRMGGPTQSMAFLSPFGLLLSSALMILGRLEFFVVLAVCIPAFWRTHS